MKNENIVYEQELIIGIFCNACIEIMMLDLSFLNLKIYGLESDHFKEYIKSINNSELLDNCFDTYAEVINNQFGYHPHMFAITPIDLKNPVSDEVFEMLQKILLVMFPSDFRLYGKVHYIVSEQIGKFEELYFENYDMVSRSYIMNIHPDELLLSFEKSEILKINSFLRLCFDRIPKLSYLNIAINSYVNSFYQRFLDMAYINYCIALESLTNSQTEVTHRICRTCAVLNSDKKEDGKIVYFNTNQFYSLRSAIVHGNSVKNLKEYFFSLQALVSRSLIELITLNLKSREELSEFIDQFGYGDKNQIQVDYKKQNFNQPIIDLFSAKVKPYRK